MLCQKWRDRKTKKLTWVKKRNWVRKNGIESPKYLKLSCKWLVYAHLENPSGFFSGLGFV